jgi:hypothetical protein
MGHRDGSRIAGGWQLDGEDSHPQDAVSRASAQVDERRAIPVRNVPLRPYSYDLDEKSEEEENVVARVRQLKPKYSDDQVRVAFGEAVQIEQALCSNN